MKSFILGTANFGTRYGKIKKNNYVNRNMANEIFDICLKNSINKIDTAPNYGNAQKIIGEYGAHKFKIYTKLSTIDKKEKDLKKNIFNQIDKTLINLKINKIDNIFFHDTSQIMSKLGIKIYEEIKRLKEAGVIKKIGFSIYSPSVIPFLIKNFDFDIIQFPCNVFDRRILKDNYISNLKQIKCDLVVRSVFLQGLLLQTLNKIPNNFNHSYKLIEKWNIWHNENNLSKYSTCIGFINSLNFKKKIIFGISNKHELEKIIKNSMNKVTVPDYFNSEKLQLIEPYRW